MREARHLMYGPIAMPGFTLTSKGTLPIQISIREKKRAPNAKTAAIAPPKTVKSRVTPKTP